MVQPFNQSVASSTLNNAETTSVTNHLYDGEKKLKGIKSFDCGNEVINKFVKNNLKAKGKASTSVVTVLLDDSASDEEPSLVGFYTASTYLLNRDSFSVTGLFGKAPPSVPVVRLEMLGVDLAYQKQGYGEELVALAMEKTAVVAKAIGCYGLYLDSHKDAVKFYKKLGFRELDAPSTTDGSTPMFLHLDAILDVVDVD